MIRSRSNAAVRPSEPADAMPSTVARIAPVEMRRVEQEAPRAAPPAGEDTTQTSAAKAQPEEDRADGRARGRARVGRLVRPLLLDRRALSGFHRRRLCRRAHGDARGEGVRLRRRREGRRQHQGEGRRRHRPHRRRRLSHCRRCGARQHRNAGRPRSRASASRSPPSRRRSSRRRRSSPRPRPMPPAPIWNCSASSSLPSSSIRASRSWSRRRRIATRRAPPCSAPRRPSRRPTANVAVLKAQQQEAAAHAGPAADDARQGRARPVVHDHPRAVRRRHRQPRGAGRRLRAAGPAPRQPRAARRRLHRRQLQGDAARQPAARPARVDLRSMRSTAAPSTARVESVAPASGSVFSLLPPDNATGNFTKIVQRVPVRIAVPAEVGAEERAAAGHVGGRQRRHQARRPDTRQQRRAIVSRIERANPWRT